MSAECNKCGADITYPAETWPVGSCEPCDLRAERDRLREALKLAHGCLLEVRRDFDAPINNVIAEVRAALGGTHVAY